jgi:tRNA threonylcarbamoyladenosine biosynthesis protein TsaB
MTVLTLRTDRPEAELGLYDGQEQLAYTKWQAHLELSKTVHEEIKKILNKSSISLDDLEGIVCYSGPGSFTGLRIGLSVANALAYAQDIPIVAKTGQDWIETGIKDLQAGKNDKIALPKYGSPPNITKPHK